MGKLLKKNGVLVFAVLLCLSLIIPVIRAESPWLDGYARRQLFYWQSDLAAQDVLTVINQTGFNGDNTFYIFNETLPSFEDLAVTLSDGETRLYAWNQTTYEGLNCTFWVNFPVANASYWLYWSNPDAINGWDQENTFEDVIDGVVGAWLMNEDNETDTVLDYSSNDNDGTPTGTTITTGRLAGMTTRSFDGVTDNINIPYSTSLNFTNPAITTVSWIYPISSGTIQCFIGKGAGLAQFFIEIETSNVIRFTVRNAAGSDLGLVSALTVTTNTWNFVVGTNNGTTTTVYVNEASQNAAKTLTEIKGFPSEEYAKIGMLNPSYPRNFNGTLGEQYIFNTSLTTSNIENMFEFYGDPEIIEGLICCRVWASSEITEWGTVESAPTTSETEDYWVIGFVFGVIAISMAVAFGVMRKR